MIIDSANAYLLNTKAINLHDDIFISMTFHREDKQLILYFKEYASKNDFVCIFNGVLGFETSSCDFWGASECVFSFDFIADYKERLLSKKLKAKSEEYDVFKVDCLTNDYIETLFTFTSGDQMRIVSKSIEIHK